jgi:hypothetical protein
MPFRIPNRKGFKGKFRGILREGISPHAGADSRGGHVELHVFAVEIFASAS